MNKCFKNLSKIEFVVTNACTGRCKHCSEGDHAGLGERIDPEVAASAVRSIAAEYNIKTVMAFGGEPLLHTEAVYAIMSTAKDMNIERRQLITNGFFSKESRKIREVAKRLNECGVNDLLLSVDVFHQETIPVEIVREFAFAALECDIPIRLQPAWLKNSTDDNPYNRKTREILDSFLDMDISVGTGNVIFPEGNALKYLSEYFKDNQPENPYVEDPSDLRCVSVSPNGDVLGGNIYLRDIIEIIKDY